jgi:hypothetical protein
MTMAQPLSSKAPREPKLDVTVIAAVVLCALLGAAFAYWRMGPGKPVTDQNFQFSDIEIDQAELDAQRQAKYASANLQEVQSEWQDLVAASREANQAQFGGATQEEQLTLSATVRVWANEVVLGSGFDSFVVTGEPLFRECRAGLEELLGAVQRGELSVEQAKSGPAAQTFGTYRANCGNLFPVLLERGLVSSDGKWTSENADLIVDIMSRYRWAHIIHDQRDPWAQLTQEGARVFARWRVEQASRYTLGERRRFLDKLATQFPNYNATFAAGVLAYRAGEFDTALDHFETLAQNQPRSKYKRYADFLRLKTSNPGSHSASSEAKKGATKGAPKPGPAAAEKTD